ncbi:hypothetical protein [Pedobacter heparinus]|uniref:hypothetical protein n=1 Tax=Pedobacter heparinus TaxID=984 RepID=UPI00292FFCAA|nr:hypothetical protein [Pedobacter heparinus]
MEHKNDRRDFIKKISVASLGLVLADGFSKTYASSPAGLALTDVRSTLGNLSPNPSVPFVPQRAASWWVTIEDLQWSQKKIVDKIKRRAAAFAEAEIDLAINYGWHIRFDFSNYFGQVHGYMANVCDELHKYNIKFMDHYSCNHVERPRGAADYKALHRGQRHHVLLFHDPKAAQFAQYEGHFFNDICEVDIRDGSRGYSRQYQMETFCHNNPAFLDMHGRYLERLLKEVPIDGIEVDDMCDYSGLTTCGCKYCRERFKKDYGHEIPAFGEKSFWGDVKKPMLQWGNYENPAFRDWLRMKTDVIVDHVKMVKKIVGDKPLMSCCSSTGPIVLNGISLDLEKMAPHLDFFMLENVGTNIKSVDWTHMDAEALNQKDIADKRGKSPAMALSYTIYEKGGYFGWALSRFWGVGNWSSTHNQRLEEDPADAMEMEDVIRPSNLWEVKHSGLKPQEGKDLVEVRVVNNKLCKDNGWRDQDGQEHWTHARNWSKKLLENNVGYRFVRYEELADAAALKKEQTPLVLDGVGCVSDEQFKAIKTYLAAGGKAWMALPFGTHDGKGFKRSVPLADELQNAKYKNLIFIESITKTDTLNQLIDKGILKPVLRQTGGSKGWVARIRIYKDKPAIHFMNTALIGIPHPTIKDNSGISILSDIGSKIENNNLQYEIHTDRIKLTGLKVSSPELAEDQRNVAVLKGKKGHSTFNVNLNGIKIYAELTSSV